MAEFSASDSEGEVYEVEKILDSRKTGRTTEYLVKWRNFDESSNSWEPQRNLSGAKDAMQAFLNPEKTPAAKSTSKKTVTSTKTAGGSTITKTVTTTSSRSSKADLSSPENSPVLRRRTVETTRSVTVSSGDKNAKKGPSAVGCCWATIKDIPRPIMIQILCMLIVFGTFLPLK